MLSKGRADDLLNRPLQETDLLLHEAGVPPLHTTFAELSKLPNRVKKRMYVVHSSKIPEEFDLRKAPTGTAGTLRLDQLQNGGDRMTRFGVSTYVNKDASPSDESLVRFKHDVGSEYVDNESGSQEKSRLKKHARTSIVVSGKKSKIPLVSLRPTSNTDSWYILNLLQAVPFLTR